MSYLNGIDVSSAQGKLNVKNVKCSFVLIKATGGTSYVNPYCNKHYSQCVSSHKLKGLYHFAHEYGIIKPAPVEAIYFIKNIKNYVGHAVLALDYERPIGTHYTQKDVDWIHDFLVTVYTHTKIMPMLYISKTLLSELNFSKVAKLNCGLWCAQYANYNVAKFTPNYWTDNKGYGAFKNVAIFQYSSNGRVQGASNTPLDLNIFYGNKNAWLAYQKPHK